MFLEASVTPVRAKIQQSGHFLQPSSFPAQDNMAECSWAHGQGERRRLPGARQEITPAADLQLHRWGENGSTTQPRLHLTVELSASREKK